MSLCQPPTFDRSRFDNEHAAAFRALVLVNTLGKLRRSGDMPPDLDAELLASLDRLGAFLADPRNYQGEHNHGFSEAAALLAVAENLPGLPGAPAWRDLARLLRFVERALQAPSETSRADVARALGALGRELGLDADEQQEYPNFVEGFPGVACSLGRPCCPWPCPGTSWLSPTSTCFTRSVQTQR